MKPANTDPLDRILSTEEELAPSSGFTASVMDRVRQEAGMPEPMPFPWKRALPGAVAVAIGLAWCVVQMVRMGIAEAKSPLLVTLHPSALVTLRLETAGYVATALVLSLPSWLIARRIMGRGGLV